MVSSSRPQFDFPKPVQSIWHGLLGRAQSSTRNFGIAGTTKCFGSVVIVDLDAQSRAWTLSSVLFAQKCIVGCSFAESWHCGIPPSWFWYWFSWADVCGWCMPTSACTACGCCLLQLRVHWACGTTSGKSSRPMAVYCQYTFVFDWRGSHLWHCCNFGRNGVWRCSRRAWARARHRPCEHIVGTRDA